MPADVQEMNGLDVMLTERQREWWGAPQGGVLAST